MNTITTSSATTGDHASRAARRTVRRDAKRAGGRRAGHLVGAALIAAALGASAGAQAARFGVRVVDAFGEPVAGASVCVGLEGNYRQFGTAFTDADGLADMLEVPNVPLVVTVSKTRFAGDAAAGARTRVRHRPRADPGRGAARPALPRRQLDGGEPADHRRARRRRDGRGDGNDADAHRHRLAERVPRRARRGPARVRGRVAAGSTRRSRCRRALADARSIVLQLRRQVGDERASIEALSDVVTVELAGDDEPSDG